MNKFIDRYYNKWIVRGLVIVWVLFMLKLILMWVSIWSSTSWWFLALPAFWDFEYYWMSSSYIWLILIIISIYFIYKISKTKNKTNKILLALIIFFLWLISKQVFFLFSPDFKFYMTPVTSQYKDKEGNVTDVDKYLDSIWKYCDYKIGGALGYKRARVDMCTENDKYQTFFKWLYINLYYEIKMMKMF